MPETELTLCFFGAVEVQEGRSAKAAAEAESAVRVCDHFLAGRGRLRWVAPSKSAVHVIPLLDQKDEF